MERHTENLNPVVHSPDGLHSIGWAGSFQPEIQSSLSHHCHLSRSVWQKAGIRSRTQGFNLGAPLWDTGVRSTKPNLYSRCHPFCMQSPVYMWNSMQCHGTTTPIKTEWFQHRKDLPGATPSAQHVSSFTLSIMPANHKALLHLHNFMIPRLTREWIT